MLPDDYKLDDDAYPFSSELTIDGVRNRLLEMVDMFPAGLVFQVMMDAVDVIDWMERRLEPRVFEDMFRAPKDPAQTRD